MVAQSIALGLQESGLELRAGGRTPRVVAKLFSVVSLFLLTPVESTSKR